MPPRWGGRHEAATPELAEALEELSRHEKVTATMEAELRHLQAATAHALRESQGAAAQAEEVRAEAAAVVEKLQGASDGRAGRAALAAAGPTEEVARLEAELKQQRGSTEAARENLEKAKLGLATSLERKHEVGLEVLNLSSVLAEQRKVAKTHEAQRNQRAKAYTACKTRNANLVAEFEQQRRAYSEAVQQVQETEEKTEERRAWVAVYRWRWIWIFLNVQFVVLAVLVKLFA